MLCDACQRAGKGVNITVCGYMLCVHGVFWLRREPCTAQCFCIAFMMLSTDSIHICEMTTLLTGSERGLAADL